MVTKQGRKTLLTFFWHLFVCYTPNIFVKTGSGQTHKAKLSKKRCIFRRMAVCSGYIADGVIRGLFGFMPSLEATSGSLALKQPGVDRGFEGTLRHVRYRGELWTIVASAQGVRAEKE